MIDKFTFSISINKDLENFQLESGSKINHLHLNIENKIENSKLSSIFEKLSSCDVYNRFHLNLTEFELNKENSKIIIDYVQGLKIRELNINILNCEINDELFEKFIISCLTNKQTLEKLHLTLENIDLNKNKITSLIAGLSSLPKLNHVFINIKKNNLPLEEMTELTKSLDRFYTREIHF